jgi:hypothetical protein
MCASSAAVQLIAMVLAAVWAASPMTLAVSRVALVALPWISLLWTFHQFFVSLASVSSTSALRARARC